MSQRLLALTLALVGLSLAACQSGNGELPDHVKSLSSVDNFSATQPELKAKSVGVEDFRAMLQCDKPSTGIRMEKESVSVTARIMNKRKNGLGDPTSIQAEEFGYSTKNSGQTFTKSYRLAISKANNESALPSGPYKYIQNCTAGDDEGCADIEKRVYVENSHLYAVKHQDRLSEAYFRARSKMPRIESFEMSCQSVPDEEAEKIDDVVIQGVYELSGIKYEAIRIVTKQVNNIMCGYDSGTTDSSAGQIKMGQGMTVTNRIIIGDELPYSRSSAVSSLGSEGSFCLRTEVFTSTETTNHKGRVMNASSAKLDGYTVVGKVHTQDEWVKKEKNHYDIEAELKAAVRQAERHLNDARIRYGEAQAAKDVAIQQEAAAESEKTRLQGEYDQIKDDDSVEEAVKKKALDDLTQAGVVVAEKRRARELAEKSEKSARDQFDTADTNLVRAQVALKNHQDSMKQ